MKVNCLSKEEKDLIKNHYCSEGGKFSKRWDSKDPIFSELYQKLKSEFNSLAKICSYCKESDFSAHSRCKLDHIVPKSRYACYTFEPRNLTLICDLCNEHKSNKDVFKKKPSIISPDVYPLLSEDYKIIHPYIDDYFNHIEIDIIYYPKRINNNLSEKGINTILLCKLNREELILKHCKIVHSNGELEAKNNVDLFKKIASMNGYSRTTEMAELELEIDTNYKLEVMKCEIMNDYSRSKKLVDFIDKIAYVDLIIRLQSININQIKMLIELLEISKPIIKFKSKKAIKKELVTIKDNSTSYEKIHNVLDAKEPIKIIRYMFINHSYKKMLEEFDDDILNISNKIEVLKGSEDKFIDLINKVIHLSLIFQKYEKDHVKALIEVL